MAGEDDMTTTTKVVVKADIQLKTAFDAASKSFKDYFKATDDFWKNETQRVKDHDEAVKKLALRISGAGKENLAGAFAYAAVVAEAYKKGIEKGKETSEKVKEYAEKSLIASADYEKAFLRVLATGKESREEIEKFAESSHNIAASVGKDIEDVLVDRAKLLTSNDKLKEFLPTMERITKITTSSFKSVMDMANTAWIAGIENKDMPDFLKRAGWELQEIGEVGIHAVDEVLKKFITLQIKGNEAKQQVVPVIAGLTGSVLGPATNVAESLNKFIEDSVTGKADSSIKGLRQWALAFKNGEINLIQYLDKVVEISVKSPALFDKIFENDENSKAVIIAYRQKQELVHELWDKVLPDLSLHPMVNAETEKAMNHLYIEMRDLLAVTADLFKFKDLVELIADALERTNRALHLLPQYSDQHPIMRGLAEQSPIGSMSAFAGIIARMLRERNNIFGYTPPKDKIGHDDRIMPAPGPWNPAPGDPKKFADGGTVDRDTLAMTGERGPEAIMGSDGIKRITDKATISTLNAGDSVVPMAGASTGLPRQQTPGFNPETARYGPDPGGGYYTKATTYGGHPGDPSRGIPRIEDRDDRFGSNQAGVKEEHQGISLPGTPFGGTETRGPELNKLYQVQLPDGSYTLQRVTDTGPGHKGHGGTDISMGAISREYGGDPRKFGGGNIRYKRYEGGQLPSSMRAGRNLVTAGGYLDTSSGEGTLPYGSAEHDIPGRYQPPTAQAYKPMKAQMEVAPPPRHQIERAARYTSQMGDHHSAREHQARHAGQIGFQ